MRLRIRRRSKRPRRNNKKFTPPIAAKNGRSHPGLNEGKKCCDIFVFNVFDNSSFDAGRHYALDLFQSRGEPALRVAPRS